MKIHFIWEHNDNNALLYAVNYIGAYTRGESLVYSQAAENTAFG